MPKEILLSQIGDREQFETAVAGQIERLKAFANEVGTPRPVAHPIVEVSIKRVIYPRSEKKPDSYEPDYVIIDDTPKQNPTTPLSLVDRKNVLLAQLRATEIAAGEKILPQLKRRLFAMNFNAAMSKPEKDRTEQDNEIIADYQTMQKRFASLEMASATAEAGLADLTEDNIDSWQVPDFG